MGSVWAKGGWLRRVFLGVLLDGGLVGLDAQHKVAAFFLRDELRGFFLAVERIGGDDGEGRGVRGAEFKRAKFFLRVRSQRFEPEPLGMVVPGEEVAAVAREAGGVAHRFPAGGLVTSAGVGFGIGEGLGQERRVAVLREPGLGRCGGGGGEDFWEAR